MRTRTILLLLILSLSLSFADSGFNSSCNRSVSFTVPAVVGTGGGLVGVTMSESPPHGQFPNVYVSILPNVGLMTQASLEQAVAYAQYAANYTESCDIYIQFDTPQGAGSVDGPSAGVALTTMAYSLFTGKPLRNDTIITGAIDPSGAVDPVGGLYEKGSQVAVSGATYFITPVENIYELLLLQRLENQTGLIVLQAENISDVINFMTNNQSIVQHGLEATSRSTPNVSSYNSSGLEDLEPMAMGMINSENSLISQISGSDNDSVMLRSFFTSEVARQQGILAKGYYYAAANEAFLDYIDLSSIQLLLSPNSDPASTKQNVTECLNLLDRPAMTVNNYQWVIGGDLRYAWAEDQLSSVDTSNQSISDEKYAQYNELMYANAWCTVASQFYSAANTVDSQNPSPVIDESVWKPLAESELTNAESETPANSDIQSRLAIAKESYSNGMYGAAIFDAIYVSTSNAIASQSPTQAELNASDVQLLSENRTSLWGKIYQSQGVFLYEQQDYTDAYSVLAFAQSLDAASTEMSNEVSLAPVGPLIQVQRTQPGYDLQTVVLITGIALLFTAFVLLGAMMLIKGGKRNGANDKGTRKAYRAEEKKS